MESAFDVPPQDKCRMNWKGELPIDDGDWNIGLIVGPSGCGKSTLLTHIFGAQRQLDWGAASVIDDFAKTLSIETITQACQSVGFNTIPAWLRPFAVLSNGEKFRADIARRMLETAVGETIVIDEFTSVVDRQVAQIASHAIQKFVRKRDQKMVVASCHFDIIDWLQPDWILEPATMQFSRRSLRRRPEIEISIRRVHHSAWRLFAPYHYLTAELASAAQCFVMFVGEVPAVFCGVLHRPHPRVKDISGLSRVVTLPDFQGLGLAFVLMDTLASAYKGVGRRFHTYPAHPALISSFDKSSKWAMHKRPGVFSPMAGKTSTMKARYKGRPCAVFSYEGEAMDKTTATRLLAQLSQKPISVR